MTIKASGNMKEIKCGYLAQLERFGYVLTAIGETDEQARNAVMSAYLSAYINQNGTNPAKDIAYEYYDERTYWDIALDEICVTKMAFGSVEWM